jgi:aldehyde:ferredoxin oxidoreductase
MSNGFFGKVLWIDLSEETIKEETIDDKIYREYLGGYALGCKLIYENMKPNMDPLSEQSIIGFFPGLLTGTPAPFSGRYMVVGKSPLTGTWGDANSGGTFGPEIKKCGYDGILIIGKAETPKYISIIDGKKEIRNASEIWGLDIIEAENKLKETHGRFIKTAGIGVAGEKLSKISGIANDGGRIAARSGLGAIMGSKKLKTIALKGKERAPVYNKQKFLNLIKEYNKDFEGLDGKLMKKIIGQIPKIPKLMSKFGTTSGGPASLIRRVYRHFGTPFANTLSALSGDSPVKNWKGVGIEDFPAEKVKKLSVNKINEYKIKDYGCYSCPIQCGAIMEIPELNIDETHLPEYETWCSFGTLLLNDDLMSIFQINDMCNRAAIDTISTGATIAFAIECFEEGIITKEDTDGLELSWGNSSAIVELTKKIINREGFGDILADGTRIASQKIGKGSEKFAMTSLGSELPMHDPKVYKSLALSYAYDPTPGRHTTGSGEFEDTGPYDKFETSLEYPPKKYKDMESTVKTQYLNIAFHQTYCAVGLCIFGRYMGEYPFIELLNAFTGWDLTVDECVEIGLRIQTLRQAFTLREGIDIINNKIPGRAVGDPPQTSGPNKGVTIEYKENYEKLCEKFGWNSKNGYPLETTLQDLDLEFVINDFY